MTPCSFVCWLDDIFQPKRSGVICSERQGIIRCQPPTPSPTNQTDTHVVQSNRSSLSLLPPPHPPPHPPTPQVWNTHLEKTNRQKNIIEQHHSRIQNHKQPYSIGNNNNSKISMIYFPEYLVVVVLVTTSSFFKKQLNSLYLAIEVIT